MKNIYSYNAFLTEKNNTNLIVESVKVPDAIKKVAKVLVDKYPKQAKKLVNTYKGMDLKQIIAKLKPSTNQIEQKLTPQNEGLKDFFGKIKDKLSQYQDQIDKILTTVGLVGLGAGVMTTVIDATNAIPGIGQYGDSLFTVAVALLIMGVLSLVANKGVEEITA